MAEQQHVPGLNPLGIYNAAVEYMTDAAQRSVLFFDVMRQRGEQYQEHLAETVPHVLDYKAELVMDGRTLKRPVNYLLVRIVPPAGVEIDPDSSAIRGGRSTCRPRPRHRRLSRPTAKSALP